MINTAILIGRIGKDPEVKTIKQRKMCKFSIATSKKVNGEERTTWHNVVIWNEHSAGYVEKYASVGSLIYIQGEIDNRSYEKDGQTRYISEVVVGAFNGEVKILNGFKEDQKQSSSAKSSYKRESSGAVHDPRDDLDDEIPF